jgi:ATP-dependent protease ClpP protease subunit
MNLVLFGLFGKDVPSSERFADAFSFALEFGEDVNLFFDSYGGSLDEAGRISGMITAHQASGGVINAYLVGDLASAAVIPFLLVKKGRRFIAKGARVLIHEARVSADMVGGGDVAALAEYIETTNKMLAESYASLLDIGDEKAVRKLMKEERWLTDKEALEYGFASGYMSDDMLSGIKGEKAPAQATVAEAIASGNWSMSAAVTADEAGNQSARSLRMAACIMAGGNVPAKDKKTEGKGMDDTGKKEGGRGGGAVLTAEAERARITGILALGDTVPRDVVLKAIADGTDPGAVAIEALKTMSASASADKAAQPAKAGATELPTISAVVSPAGSAADSGEAAAFDGYVKRWNASAALQKIYFAGPEVYAAAMVKRGVKK